MSRALRWINAPSVLPAIVAAIVAAIVPVIVAAIVLALAGCASTGRGPDADLERPPWPPAIEPAGDRTVFEIVEDASSLRVIVAPAGSLARLGHHHVIGGPVLSGRVLLGETADDSRIELAVDVAALVVDRAAWRAEEGLEPLDDDTIEATRSNLLGPEVLAVEDHPRIEVRSVSAVGPGWQVDVTARVRVRGVVSELVVPVSVQRDAGRLVAVGAFDVDQTALGLQPFSTAGGALRVADSMRIRFRIVARPASG